MTATYGYDCADRQESLTVQVGSDPAIQKEVITHCSTIEAGNGYTVDGTGDVTFQAGDTIVLDDGFSVLSGGSFTAIAGGVAGTTEVLRSYTYQPDQYYLTSASGPWGSRSWTYDRIGNRLSETRDGASPDTYAYTSNGTGNTPILDQVSLGIGGTRAYTWDAAGNLDQVAAGANVIDFTFDQASRLASSDRTAAGSTAGFLYDGRGFLRESAQTAGGTALVDPVYDSTGLVHELARQASPSDPIERTLYLYLAGRPIAQLGIDGTGADATSGAGVYYNVNRWYQPATDSYTRPDPLGLREGGSVYIYAEGDPLRFSDPLGLKPCSCDDQCPGGEWDSLASGFSGAGVAGKAYSFGLVTCRSNPNAHLLYRSECWILGLYGGIGAGVEVTTSFAPSFCGCNVDDLLGVSNQFLGSLGPVSGAIGKCKGSSDGSRFTFALSFAKSIGGGGAWLRCRTERIFGR